jgi:hypothetical protein
MQPACIQITRQPWVGGGRISGTKGPLSDQPEKSAIHKMGELSSMFVCEGCAETVERKKPTGRKPKPPFCRSCYCKNRDLLRAQRTPRNRTTCQNCGEDLPLKIVDGIRSRNDSAMRHCSLQCAAISYGKWRDKHLQTTNAAR